MIDDELEEDDSKILVAVLGEEFCPQCEGRFLPFTLRHRCEDDNFCRMDLIEREGGVHVMLIKGNTICTVWRMDESGAGILVMRKAFRELYEDL